MTMRLGRVCIGAASLAALLFGSATPAFARPMPPAAAQATAGRTAAPVRFARASLSVALGHGSTWLGQPIPITLSAQFRDVEGVTLEGVPQIKSDGIFTSDLSRDPRQATEIINGEPVLVATWTGTITPSTAGPLALSVELPVRIRYHEAAPQPVFRQPEPSSEDPFEDMMNIDPADPGSIQRVFQSMQRSFSGGLDSGGFEQPVVGRAHDEALTLKAASRPLSIRELPTEGQPRDFGGAVGRFGIRAAVPASTPHASEPITLTVTVTGQGDLDRVDLAGLQSSADWKTYPMSSKTEAAVPGKKIGTKTFEQVLVPTHGGELIIPPVSLSAFDPSQGRYTTIASAPLTVDVDGPPALPASAVAAPTPSAQLEPPGQDATPIENLRPPVASALVDNPGTFARRLAPILGILALAGLARLRAKQDSEKVLRRTLQRAAKQGSSPGFFDAARRLIVLHFSKRWHVPEVEVTVAALRSQLGAEAEPLVNAMLTADALRFGRRDLEPIELGALCSSIEASLRDAR